MAASKSEIASWVKTAHKTGYRWMLVGVDMFDHEDYPVFIKTDDELWERIDQFRKQTGSMDDRLIECYDLSMDLDSQLDERRAWHLPTRL